MRVLVTGGAGFIGSHVTDVLAARGYAVTVLNKSTDKNNLREHLNNPNFRFIEGDIRDTKAIQRSLAGVKAVIHEAALASVPQSIREPELFHAVNVGGTLSLLRASLETGVKRFVLASTSAVYGDPNRLPTTEEAPPSPLSPYARTKLLAENHCREFNLKGLSTVCLRYFNVYGPRQSHGEHGGIMTKFIGCVREGQPPIIYGDGEQGRDFVYVGDVAEATVLALEKSGAAGETINVGTGEMTTINELWGLFTRLTGKTHLKPVYEPARPGEVYRSQADTSKARKLLGFEPSVTLEEGVKRLLEGVGLIR
ncbi:MAG TPA: SDR family NAD(P)-dependent oxidoreductase [Hadesarchaea archaeon]|nr:SDR family NAD(P)-dependent oxidoreductase [Hadesarchaea archaeon]